MGIGKINGLFWQTSVPGAICQGRKRLEKEEKQTQPIWLLAIKN